MHEHFDGHRAFLHIQKLAALRRLPGTPGESIAQSYIRGVGEDIGVPMKSEEFTYSSAPLTVVLPVICLALAAVCVVGSLTYLWGTSLSIIPGAVLLVALFLAFKWSAAFERFGATGGKRRSVNIIGEVEARNPDGAGLIILSAHYDSKSQLMPVVVRASLFMLGFFGATLLGVALVVVGILMATGKDVTGSRSGFYVTLVPAVFLILLVFNFTGNRSPGALDNASGEAVILEAGRVLADAPLERFDVRIASFGCEEMGLCGGINYLLAHEEELRGRPTYMLNVDMPFSTGGRLFVNSGFELPACRTSKKLNDFAREVGREMGIEIPGIYLPVGAAADHMPWVKHGIEATGFVSAATYVHSSRDDVEKINREALRRVGEVVLGVARKLDQEPAETPPS